MRKNIVGILILILILSGCTNVGTMESDINTTITKVASIESDGHTNHHRSYFDFYLPRNIGLRPNTSLDIDNAEFVLDGTSFYMSLDISQVIINKYYDALLRYQINKYMDIINVGTSVVNISGEMETFEGVMRKYKIIANQLNEKDYFVYVSYGDVYFVSLANLAEINNLVYAMLQIGRSVQVDTDLVIAEYSNKSSEVIYDSYDLFKTVIPESGVVADLIKDDSTNVVEDENYEGDYEYEFTGEFASEEATDTDTENKEIESEE